MQILKREEWLPVARKLNWNFTYTSERLAECIGAMQLQPGTEVNRARSYFGARGCFKAGSINVRSVSGSNRFGIAIGSTVTITSSVGDT